MFMPIFGHVPMASLSEAALMVCTLTYCPGVPSTAVNKARLQEKWQSCKYHKLCEDLSCSGQRGGYILGTRYSLPYGMCVCVGGGGGREGGMGVMGRGLYYQSVGVLIVLILVCLHFLNVYCLCVADRHLLFMLC